MKIYNCNHKLDFPVLTVRLFCEKGDHSTPSGEFLEPLLSELPCSRWTISAKARRPRWRASAAASLDAVFAAPLGVPRAFFDVGTPFIKAAFTLSQFAEASENGGRAKSPWTSLPAWWKARKDLGLNVQR